MATSPVSAAHDAIVGRRAVEAEPQEQLTATREEDEAVRTWRRKRLGA